MNNALKNPNAFDEKAFNSYYKKEYVSDVMSKNPHLIKESKSLTDATKLMVKHDCGFLIVVNENDDISGVITDRDIVFYGIAEEKLARDTQVKEVMTSNVISCYENETLEFAADHISENGIKRLVVLDKNSDKLKGVVSIVDMIKHVEDDSINIEVVKHLFKYA